MSQPPYVITTAILNLVASVSRKIGEVDAAHLVKPETELRKKNRIRTIQSTLEIEGNTMTEAQITALLNDKPVIAPAQDLLEVQNAINVYESIGTLNYSNIHDFKKAHRELMKGLVDTNGQFRKTNVGVIKGSEVTHLAPPGHLVSSQMNELFDYLLDGQENTLIKSCVFHYELEFIHPFIDGNGRMGRLWQTLILMSEFPVFEFLPVEHLIKLHQQQYYQALGDADKSGSSTPFIAFMLQMIDKALDNRLEQRPKNLTPEKRLELFHSDQEKEYFTRKEYLQKFKEISTATASRDLHLGVVMGVLLKSGDKRNTRYRYKK